MKGPQCLRDDCAGKPNFGDDDDDEGGGDCQGLDLVMKVKHASVRGAALLHPMRPMQELPACCLCICITQAKLTHPEAPAFHCSFVGQGKRLQTQLHLVKDLPGFG